MIVDEAGGWARGYAACREAQRTELEWQRAEIERLTKALRYIAAYDRDDEGIKEMRWAKYARGVLEQSGPTPEDEADMVDGLGSSIHGKP